MTRTKPYSWVTAWKVVGPTGHTVAVYRDQMVARRVAAQLGMDAVRWRPDTANDPRSAPLTDRGNHPPHPPAHAPLSQVNTGSAARITGVGEPSEHTTEPALGDL